MLKASEEVIKCRDLEGKNALSHWGVWSQPALSAITGILQVTNTKDADTEPKTVN